MIGLKLEYSASRSFSHVFLSVVLPFSSLFWLLAFCFGRFCAVEKTSADSRLGFLLSMRCRYLQDLGGNHINLDPEFFCACRGEGSRALGNPGGKIVSDWFQQKTIKVFLIGLFKFARERLNVRRVWRVSGFFP